MHWDRSVDWRTTPKLRLHSTRLHRTRNGELYKYFSQNEGYELQILPKPRENLTSTDYFSNNFSGQIENAAISAVERSNRHWCR